jgi:hypothetical protein
MHGPRFDSPGPKLKIQKSGFDEAPDSRLPGCFGRPLGSAGDDTDFGLVAHLYFTLILNDIPALLGNRKLDTGLPTISAIV